MNSSYQLNNAASFRINLKKIKTIFQRIDIEAIIWISALVFLAIYTPTTESHFTICPLKNMGIDFCPGCGLGSSVSYALHGKFLSSFNTHPLGIFALLVLLHRIFTLIKFNRRNNG